MDFRSDLIIDVKTKEETLDVSRLDMLSLLEIDGCSQNFFTNVKARVAQARDRGPSADGKHHFDESERKLVQACVPLPISKSSLK